MSDANHHNYAAQKVGVIAAITTLAGYGYSLGIGWVERRVTVPAGALTWRQQQRY